MLLDPKDESGKMKDETNALKSVNASSGLLPFPLSSFRFHLSL
jgi:hypothetical protein